MPRRINIKWRKVDAKRLSSAARKFNAKITRLEKRYKNMANVILPERVNTKELKKNILTRKDYNRIIRELESLSRVGYDKIVEINADIKATKWTQHILKVNMRAYNLLFEKENDFLHSLPATVMGEDVGISRGDMEDTRQASRKLKATSVEDIKLKDFNRIFRDVELYILDSYQSEKQERFIDNYKTALYNVFGEQAYEIIDYIESLTVEEFMNVYKREELSTIDFIYDELENEAQASALLDIWEGAANSE